MKVEPIIRTPEEWFRERMEERRENRKKGSENYSFL